MYDDDSDLTEREQEVRSLLAGARHPEPMPGDVVARLDRVLAGLSTEPARTASVVRLTTRRRRAASLLVAAAAVVAIGVGVGVVIEPDGSGDAASTTAEDRLETGLNQAAPEKSDPGGTADVPGTVQGVSADLVPLRPQHFAEDVTAARLPRDTARGSQFLFDGQISGRTTAAEQAAGAACGSSAWGKGSFVPVRYGDVPAVLVVRRTRGETQVVDLFLCGSAEPVRSVTLPAP